MPFKSRRAIQLSHARKRRQESSIGRLFLGLNDDDEELGRNDRESDHGETWKEHHETKTRRQMNLIDRIELFSHHCLFRGRSHATAPSPFNNQTHLLTNNLLCLVS
jgi:hypothetical protein